MLQQLLNAEHVPANFGEPGIRPDLRVPLQDVVGQNGGVAAHQGD